MPELEGLRAAVDIAAERAQVPDFTRLQARARTRRRRRHSLTVGGLLAAALVVAAVIRLDSGTLPGANNPMPATHTHAQHTRGPQTPQPTPKTPGTRGELDALTAKQIVATGHLYSYGSGGSGEVVTVWQVCIHDSLDCRYAWRIADQHDQRAIGVAWSGDGASGPVVVPAGGSYVLTSWNRRGFVVSPSGTVMPLHLGPSEPLRTDGSTAVIQAGRTTGIRTVDTRTGATWVLPGPPGADGVEQVTMAADGTIWAMPASGGPGQVEVSWLTDGHWQSRRLTDPRVGPRQPDTPGPLAVSGTRTGDTRIAALASYNGATVLPVGVLAVSADSGHTWRQLTRTQVPFTYVDSMAASAVGILYVADPNGRVWISVDSNWDRFARIRGVHAYGLQPAGEQVLARLTTSYPRLVLIGPNGTVQPVAAR